MLIKFGIKCKKVRYCHVMNQVWLRIMIYFGCDGMLEKITKPSFLNQPPNFLLTHVRPDMTLSYLKCHDINFLSNHDPIFSRVKFRLFRNPYFVVQEPGKFRTSIFHVNLYIVVLGLETADVGKNNSTTLYVLYGYKYSPHRQTGTSVEEMLGFHDGCVIQFHQMKGPSMLKTKISRITLLESIKIIILSWGFPNVSFFIFCVTSTV